MADHGSYFITMLHGNDTTGNKRKRQRVLWNALDTDNFSFLLFNFSDFILILFCFL